MTRVGDTLSSVTQAPGAAIAPDGRRFVVVTHRGNLQQNTNDYTMLLFSSGAAARLPTPQVLLTLQSSSSAPAISEVRWLANGERILFLGEQPGTGQQIYCFDVATRALEQLTHHSTDIVDFDATEDLHAIVYLAHPVPKDVISPAARDTGVLVTDQDLAELISGHTYVNAIDHPAELFMQVRGHEAERIVFRNQETAEPTTGMSLSPDGRFGIMLSNTRRYVDEPEWWSEYRTVGDVRNEHLVYLLIDTRDKSTRLLVDAPTDTIGRVGWEADSQSVVVGGTYLPLNIADVMERELRRTKKWAVEVNVVSGAITKLAQGDYAIASWDPRTAMVVLKPFSDPTFSGAGRGGPDVTFRKTNGTWERLAHRASALDTTAHLRVQVEEDMNRPPKLVVARGLSGIRTEILDLNPQFRRIQFNRVEEFMWSTLDGTQYKGGLYVPFNHVPGERHPLLIQTHYWNPAEFLIDGWTSAGYAAQALAGAGVVVAQLPVANQLGAGEGAKNLAMFESLIDALDHRGIVDRSRVGLLGFSRTGYHVRYMLTFSRYPVMAAAIVDGMGGGYWQYLADLNLEPSIHREVFEAQNGAAPFGNGLKIWTAQNPSFNLDRVRTPVRQIGLGPKWFEWSWEWFVGLRRLSKPIEQVWLPEAEHPPVRPLERIAAQQGNYDWFRFWLQGYEDPSQEKAEQYRRWEKLCDMQVAQNPNQPAFCVRTKSH